MLMLLLVMVIVLGVMHDRQLVSGIGFEFRLQAAIPAHAPHAGVHAELQTFASATLGNYSLASFAISSRVNRNTVHSCIGVAPSAR